MNLMFLDIETTGLNPFKDRILELYITDLENTVDLNFVYNLPEDYDLDPNIVTMHKDLIPLCHSSTLDPIEHITNTLPSIIPTSTLIVGKNVAKFDYIFLLTHGFPVSHYLNFYDIGHIGYTHGSTWPTLSYLATTSGYPINSITHRAKDDTILTRDLYKLYYDLA